MGLKQSIHDINVYNAVSYNEDIIPINKMNKINSIYSHMKNQFNMPTNGIIDKNRINIQQDIQKKIMEDFQIFY